MLFADVLATNFTKAEIMELIRSLQADPSGFGGSVKSIAHDLERYMDTRGVGLLLLQQVKQERSFIDMTPYLYLALRPAFSFSEINEWHKQLNLQPPLDRYNSAAYGQSIVNDYLENGRIQEFIDRVTPRVPAITALLAAPPPAPAESSSAPEVPAAKKPAGSLTDDYVNFDVIINPRQSDNSYSIRFSSPEGETRIQVVLPGEQDDFDDRIYYLRELMGGPEDAEILGGQLKNFIFAPTAWNLFSASLAKVRAQNMAGLRVRLHIDLSSPELNKIPWEYCRDDKSFMAVNKQTPIIRYIPTNRAAKSISVPDQVRILLVTASPTDQELLHVDDEVENIKEALTDLIAEGRVQIQEALHASRRDLRKKVQDFDPHILHFVGHGMLQENGEGVLALQGRSGKTQFVDADDMLVLLQDRSTRLVILSACETGARSDAEAGAQGLMGVAPKLVWGGMPAVLAMQFAASDDATIDFMDTMYHSLAKGEPLDTAVTEARVGLYFDYDDKTFWANPVLFMRAPNGNIWS